MERLVTAIDNDFCALETRKDLGAAPPREFEITRDPEVAPLATFAAHLRCARTDDMIARREALIPTPT